MLKLHKIMMLSAGVAALLLLISTCVSLLGHFLKPAEELLVRSEVFGEVATGTIYTTMINQQAFESQRPATVPFMLELSATGTMLWQQKMEGVAIDYQPQFDGTKTIGLFTEPGPVKTGRYEVWKDGLMLRTLKVQDNENTDIHGTTRLKNGNYVLQSYKMHILPNNTQVQSFLFEEVNEDNEVVFVWDSINHVYPDEKQSEEMRSYWIENDINDYFHGNSIAETSDGNFLVSARHLNQILKVSRATGEILWRLGGVTSDFVFVDDPNSGFSHQHSVSELPNGNILLYDNGNLHSPPVTRMVEYRLDETSMTATLVWSYTDGRFTYATGSVQRLANGNTFIGWGMEQDMSAVKPRMTEISATGDIRMQIFFPKDVGFYNAYKM
jgi:hypothetical protein